MIFDSVLLYWTTLYFLSVFQKVRLAVENRSIYSSLL